MAAFVHPNDPVIKDLKGRVSKAIGGLPVNSSDLNTKLFLQTLYDVLRTNISYTHPDGGSLEGGRSWQHVYFGRDVLRTRAGTCIDLAVLYASVAESVGMETYIVVIPGHAFPAVRLPQSRKLFFVETTLCRNGTLASSESFSTAFRYGEYEYDEASRLGQCLVANVKGLRSYVSPPELPALNMSNPLDEWKIQMPPVRPSARVTRVVSVKHDTVVNGMTGVEIHAEVMVSQARKKEFMAAAMLFDKDGRAFRAVKAMYAEPGEMALTSKRWSALKRLLPPDSDAATYDVRFFLPYAEIPGAAEDGVEREYQFDVGVYDPVYKEWLAVSALVRFQVKRGKSATVDVKSVK
jgi:hypothetical protein